MKPIDLALHVLAVDDDLDTLRLVSRELSAAGMHVTTASSGDEALSTFDTERPDAVLLDILMRGTDGFVTCERLRALDADVPVILMTGLAGVEHLVRGFEAGATDFVTKPALAPELVARLQSHARTGRLARATRLALNASGRALLAMSGEAVAWANEAARGLLASHGLGGPASEGRLAQLLGEVRLRQARRDPAPMALGETPLLATPAAEVDAAVWVVSLAGPGDDATAAGLPVPTNLTHRETEVLVWVARGKTNRDIADILGMSPRTVNKHLEHIYEKLGVETRTAAAAVARRLRIEP